jgi:hypothetical protein
VPRDPWPDRENIDTESARLRFLRRIMVFLAVSNGAMAVLFIAVVHPMLIGSFVAAAATGYAALHISDELAHR